MTKKLFTTNTIMDPKWQGTNGTRRTMQGTFPYLSLRTYVKKHIKNTLHLHYTMKVDLHSTTSRFKFPLRRMYNLGHVDTKGSRVVNIT